jgi:hypothetical protein
MMMMKQRSEAPGWHVCHWCLGIDDAVVVVVVAVDVVVVVVDVVQVVVLWWHESLEPLAEEG